MYCLSCLPQWHIDSWTANNQLQYGENCQVGTITKSIFLKLRVVLHVSYTCHLTWIQLWQHMNAVVFNLIRFKISILTSVAIKAHPSLIHHVCIMYVCFFHLLNCHCSTFIDSMHSNLFAWHWHSSLLMDLMSLDLGNLAHAIKLFYARTIWWWETTQNTLHIA